MYRRFFSLLGPGLLYAGAAIGVSHLVQSTRAGASFGFELMWILLAANLLKFPFFEVGSRYVLATGNNLISAYFEKGKWVLLLFALMSLLTMFPVQAALTAVTAGIALTVTGLGITISSMSLILILFTLLVLIIGKFSLLDKLVKVVILLLTISTIVAVLGALMKGNQISFGTHHFDWMNRGHILFLIAFIGWMPAPIDIVVWTSLWSQAKYKKMQPAPSMREVLIEFRTGYFGTMIVAAAFLALGALVMHNSSEDLSPSGAVFAAQLIGMYTSSIGHWAYPVIAIAALTTMLSTTLTVTDAYPRTLTQSFLLLLPEKWKKYQQSQYFLWIIILSAGTYLLISIPGNSMRFLVDLATSIAFVTAPFLALLNYYVITSANIPRQFQPARYLRIWSWIGITFLSLFTAYYVYMLIKG